MGILQSENHLHLYGCLPAKELFDASSDRSKRFDARFQWFLGEYLKLTGIKLNPALWWNTSDGYELFRRQFICDKAMPFETFQAKFNLLIALFPPDPDDMTLPKAVFRAHAHEGGFKEYRTFLPLYLPAPERMRYLKNAITTAREFASNHYQPRLAISFSRQDAEAWESYRFLLDFLAQHQDLKTWITGVDFCASERGHPPSAKQNLFATFRDDADRGLHQLQILYHVGEMWQDIALHSAARWCFEAAELGCHRLGHALALGMDPESLRGRVISERIEEIESHLAWLRRHRQELHENNYTVADYNWLTGYIERHAQANSIQWQYDSELIEHTRSFQTALLAIIKPMAPIIECCPTSNIRIGALGKPRFHPLRRFLDHSLAVTIATDDPGIFDVTIASEESLAISQLGVDESELRSAEALSRSLFDASGNPQH